MPTDSHRKWCCLFGCGYTDRASTWMDELLRVHVTTTAPVNPPRCHEPYTCAFGHGMTDETYMATRCPSEGSVRIVGDAFGKQVVAVRAKNEGVCENVSRYVVGLGALRHLETGVSACPWPYRR